MVARTALAGHRIYKCLMPAGFLGIAWWYPCLAHRPPRLGAVCVQPAKGWRILVSLVYGATLATALVTKDTLRVAARPVPAPNIDPGHSGKSAVLQTSARLASGPW